MLPLHLLQRTVASALSPKHLDVAEVKASYEFDMTPALRQGMWRLQNGRVTGVLTVEEEIKPRLCMFELHADQDLGVRRYNLRPPGGQDRRLAVVKIAEEWLGVLWVMKVREYEALRRGQGGHLPKLPNEWGPIDKPHQMPCVVWVLLPKSEPFGSPEFAG